uniref:Peptidase S1 domain-containing protein n=1 Tax=Falco tinnunculus TaxID=100819 RepID=A0A8C4UAL2_FALTI
MEPLPIVLLLLLLTGTWGPTPPAEQDEDRIIGGYPCIPLSQPWQVYIYRPIRCGGVLLRDRWVLSAAHCNSR